MNEVKAFTVAVGNISLLPWHQKTNKKFFRILKEECDGFLGVHPVPPRGTLLIFQTENDAKRARNLLESYGVKCGNNICEIFIPAEYGEVKNERDRD